MDKWEIRIEIWLENLGIDVGIILKHILKKYNAKL